MSIAETTVVATSDQKIPLGPFVLEEVLGRGGMGEVWRGYHAVQGVPAAIKVLTWKTARDSTISGQLRREVRLVARLHHPGIIAVLDHGRVPAELEKSSRGRFAAGSPWLAMELAEGGPLPEGVFPTWLEVRSFLLDLLDALAHAHAREVIHRDIKPDNILLSGGRLKITDFGISHAVTGSTHSGMVESKLRGTPQYIAPEQISGLIRDQGPWTDLYSVGCLAWEITTGQPPFAKAAKSMIGLVRAHLKNEPPAFLPRVVLPEGFEEWVRRLLEKLPADRFRLAADAAWALSKLKDPKPSDVVVTHPDDATAVDVPRHATATIDAPYHVAVAEEGESPHRTALHRLLHNTAEEEPPIPTTAPLSRSKFRAVGQGLPPIPNDWYRDEPPPLSARLIGAGLELFVMRRMPLVGRHKERDVLWAALRKVTSERRAQCVIVRGPTGTGKSRLVEWIGERASEVGAARVIRARHEPSGGAGSGLGRMVAHTLACTKLEEADLRQRIHTSLMQLDIDDSVLEQALFHLVAPKTGNDESQTPSGPARLQTRRERWEAVGSLLRLLTKRRPTIVWLDDVQWGLDAIGFAQYLLEEVGDVPVLLAVVLREDVAERGPMFAVDRLSQHERAEVVQLGPLSPDEHAHLVGGLLSLEPSLAQYVTARTAGNPLFAIQLVGDWVQRGVLEVSDEGFRLRAGEEALVPDDLYQLWSERIDRLIYNADAPWMVARTALEIASVLGHHVVLREWTEACLRAGLPAPDALASDLIDLRLAKQRSEGFEFAHNMLVESLQRHAKEAGRLAQHHLVVAESLRSAYPGGFPGLAARVVHHFSAARVPERAVPEMLAAAIELRQQGQIEPALQLLRQRQSTLMSHGGNERGLADGWIETSRCLIETGRLDEAEPLLSEARRVGHQLGVPILECVSLRLIGLVLGMRGDLDRCLEHLFAGYKLVGQAADRRLEAELMCAMGDVYRLKNQHDACQSWLENGINLFREIDDRFGLAGALYSLGLSVGHDPRKGNPARAVRILEESVEFYQQLGSRGGLAMALCALSEVVRLGGDYERSEDLAQEALALALTIEHRDAPKMRLNLGLATWRRRGLKRARSLLEEAAAELEGQSQLGLLGVADAALMAVLAQAQQWGQFDRHLERASRLLTAGRSYNREVVECVELAADMCAGAGQHERARRARELADTQQAPDRA